MNDEPYRVSFAHNGRRAARSFQVAKDIIGNMAKEAKFKLEITEIPCQELQQLDTKLAEANKVISFYANQDNWCGYHRDVDTIRNDCEKAKAEDNFDILLGGRRAREYLAKFNNSK